MAATAIALLSFILLNQPQPTPILLGASPSQFTINQNNHKIYVSNVGNNSISVIDGETNKVVKNINLTTVPSYLSVNNDTGKLYVSNIGNKSISVIDYKIEPPNVQDIKLPDFPYKVEPLSMPVSMNPRTKMIYVAGYNGTLLGGSISVFNGITNKLITNIALDSEPKSISVNQNNNRIYVVGQTSDSYPGLLSVIDGSTNKVINILPLFFSPKYLSVNPKTNMVYVASNNSDYFSTNNYNDTLLIINGATNKPIDTIEYKGKNPLVNPTQISYM